MKNRGLCALRLRDIQFYLTAVPENKSKLYPRTDFVLRLNWTRSVLPFTLILYRIYRTETENLRTDFVLRLTCSLSVMVPVWTARIYSISDRVVSQTADGFILSPHGLELRFYTVRIWMWGVKWNPQARRITRLYLICLCLCGECLSYLYYKLPSASAASLRINFFLIASMNYLSFAHWL